MKRITTSRDAAGNLVAEVVDVAATSTPGSVIRAEAFAKELAPVIRDYVAGELKPVRERLAEIEARGVTFEGTYQRAADYRRGSMVVHGGSLWAAVRPITAGDAVPGVGDGWQLCAKAGRDAR